MLLVLDDQAELERIASMLASEGDITVDVSISGEAALDKLATSDFDAVISDYLRPPAMDGIDLLRNARARGYRGLFLMFTEKDDEEVALDAILNGADHFLPRCGAIGRDVALIRSILRKRALRPPGEGERRMVEGYRSVLMRVKDGFAYHRVIHGRAGESPRTMIIDANRSFEGLFASPDDPILGQNILDLLDDKDSFD